MDSSDDGALVGLVLVIAVLALIAYIILLVIAAMSALAFFIVLGIAANLVVRSLLGILGDAAGATPVAAQIALMTMMLLPVAFVLLTCLFALFIGNSSGLVWLAIVLISVPAYYWTYWAKEIPRLGWKLDLPFKTDAAMHAEEQILIVAVKTWLAVTYVRVKLFCMRLWADLKSSLRGGQTPLKQEGKNATMDG